MLPLFCNRIARPRFVAVNSKDGIEVLTLPRQHAVIVERAGLFLQMPFADHRRLVPGFAHFDRQLLSLWRNATGQAEYTVGLRVLPRDDAGSTGRTDGVVAKDTVKTHSVCRQAINVGCRFQLC